MCSEHGRLPWSTGKNLTFLFSASTRLDVTQEWDRGGAHHEATALWSRSHMQSS